VNPLEWLGFPSLWRGCIEQLGATPATASRRTQTARSETLPRLHRDDSLPSNNMSNHGGENGPTDFGPTVRLGKVVEYFSLERQEKHRLFVRDGLLRRVLDGMAFDTRSASTHWSGQGRAKFVMDEHGNLYASLAQEVGRLHHSSFLAGKPVAAAGELEVRDGIPLIVTRKSAHYKPTLEMLLQVREMFREQGIDVSGVTFEDGF
jgi:hypothetical protein